LINENQIKTLFNRLIKLNRIISIYGKSGTGKSTLAMYLTEITDFDAESTTIWVQAYERFSKKRCIDLFPKRLNKLNRIFITPRDPYKKDLKQFSQLLKELSNNEANLPPNLSNIVIDSISQPLRNEVLKNYNNPRKIVKILNNFFSESLLPLIFFCIGNNITLILIHEITYNPKINKTVPFFNDLYDRIDSIKIGLFKQPENSEKIMKININGINFFITYHIKQSGFHWVSFLKEKPKEIFFL